jgi:hypothetical protein
VHRSQFRREKNITLCVAARYELLEAMNTLEWALYPTCRESYYLQYIIERRLIWSSIYNLVTWADNRHRSKVDPDINLLLYRGRSHHHEQCRFVQLVYISMFIYLSRRYCKWSRNQEESSTICHRIRKFRISGSDVPCQDIEGNSSKDYTSTLLLDKSSVA